MNRRAFIASTLGIPCGISLQAAVHRHDFDAAAQILTRATESGQVTAATLLVRQSSRTFSQVFGEASSIDANFLLASLSKPISCCAFMTLFDQKEFQLDDPVAKFLPEFKGEGRERITIQHLLTHTSGLPDQLPENAELRARHAPLSEFVQRAIRTPLRFPPGTRYGYASMGILLVSEIAQRITNQTFATFVHETVYTPLKMAHSAMGIGSLDPLKLQQCQVAQAAPESGAGNPESRTWNWNSHYWRRLGAPWGGAHGSAADVARFLEAFVHPTNRVLREPTSRLMTQNHNPSGLRPRGLGFDISPNIGPQSSTTAFGHTGSTGTLCWADRKSDTICVVLTTLPARAAKPHPRNQVSQAIERAS